MVGLMRACAALLPMLAWAKRTEVTHQARGMEVDEQAAGVDHAKAGRQSWTRRKSQRNRELLRAGVPRTLSAEERAQLVATPGQRLVFTDIDDTIHCSMALIFHGIDTNGDKAHDIYPGVAQFQLELALGPTVQELPDPSVSKPPKVVPLSARPKELRSMLAMKENKPEFGYYKGTGKLCGFANWGLDVKLAQYGSLSSANSVAQKDFDADLPFLKYKGWKNVAPNGTKASIFVGDNGQGDARASQLMMMHWNNHSRNHTMPMIGAFIHHVQPHVITSKHLMTSYRSKTVGTQKNLEEQGIYLFRNYAHAACLAYKEGYIGAAGYRRVMEAILADCVEGPVGLRRDQKRRKTMRGDPGVRSLCRLLKPEYLVDRDEEEWQIRAAGDCDAPHRTPEESSEYPKHLLQPGNVFANSGRWMTEQCHKVRTNTLQRVSATMEWMAAHGRDLTQREAEALGMSSYVYWSMREGLHCMMQCGQPCSMGRYSQVRNFNLEYREANRKAEREIWDRLETANLTLGKTREMSWSNYCRTMPARVCQYLPGAPEDRTKSLDSPGSGGAPGSAAPGSA